MLGNEFLVPYRANIDYDEKIVTLRAIDLTVPFSVTTHSAPCVRRVKTKRTITLCPDQEAMVEVDYKPLPEGRSFMFNSAHDAAFNAVLSAKTPRVVPVKNTTQGMITIPKRFPIGKIEENADSGFLACSWATAFKAMAVGTAFTAMAIPTVATNIEPVGAALRNVSSLPVSGEFDFDKRIAAVVEHDLGSRREMAPQRFRCNP